MKNKNNKIYKKNKYITKHLMSNNYKIIIKMMMKILKIINKINQIVQDQP